MSMRSYLANELLADALVEEAHHSGCVAHLIGIHSSEDLLSPCLSCPDSEECWAWRAMDVLSYQEIVEATSRYRTRRWRKWVRSGGGRSFDRIKVVACTDGFAT